MNKKDISSSLTYYIKYGFLPIWFILFLVHILHISSQSLFIIFLLPIPVFIAMRMFKYKKISYDADFMYIEDIMEFKKVSLNSVFEITKNILTNDYTITYKDANSKIIERSRFIPKFSEVFPFGIYFWSKSAKEFKTLIKKV